MKRLVFLGAIALASLITCASVLLTNTAMAMECSNYNLKKANKTKTNCMDSFEYAREKYNEYCAVEWGKDDNISRIIRNMKMAQESIEDAGEYCAKTRDYWNKIGPNCAYKKSRQIRKLKSESGRDIRLIREVSSHIDDCLIDAETINGK